MQFKEKNKLGALKAHHTIFAIELHFQRYLIFENGWK